MSLTVVFSAQREATSGLQFRVQESILHRELGQSTTWSFTIHVESEGLGVKHLPQLASLLETAPVYARLMWNDSALGIAGQVSGLNYSNHKIDAHTRSLLKVEAHLTSPKQDIPDPFAPRRRVHRVKNLQELLDVFDPVAKTTTSLRNKLLEIEFDDGEHAAVIQDGLSDWAYLRYVLNQFYLLQTDSHLKPLVVSGSLDKQQDSEGRWLINWGAAAAYDLLGDKSNRIINQASMGGFEQLFFTNQTSYRIPLHPSSISPAIIYRIIAREGDKFDHSNYENWISQDLPRFYGKNAAMVWKIEDQLRAISKPDHAAWSTKLYTSSSEVSVLGQQQTVGEVGLRPWYGFGEVVESSRKGPWIKVHLTGFEADEKALDVRLTTTYSGTDGRKGTHTVPEKGTQVSLQWSGRFGDSILCGANVRQEPTDLESPSYWFEKTTLARTADIEVQDIGHLKIGSDLSVSLDQTSEIKGAAQMELEVDGTEVKLSKGIFHTGKA